MNHLTRTVILALSLAFLFTSCKKDKTVAVIDPPVDDIETFEFTPSIYATTFGEYWSHPSGCGTVILPQDSSANASFDADGDGIDDFTIQLSNWYNWVSASGPCANYNYSSSVVGLSEDAQLAVEPNYYGIALPLDSGAWVFQETHWWSQSAFLGMDAAMVPFYANFSGQGYLGFRLLKEDQYVYGWIFLEKTAQTIEVSACAVNHTPEVNIQIPE